MGSASWLQVRDYSSLFEGFGREPDSSEISNLTLFIFTNDKPLWNQTLNKDCLQVALHESSIVKKKVRLVAYFLNSRKD